MSEFDDFQDFEDFDPRGEEEAADIAAFDAFEAQPAAEEMTVEMLGAMSDSGDEVQALVAARAEIEALLMPTEPVASAAAADEAEPYDPSNVVAVGIGEKLVDGAPTGRLAVKVLVREKLPRGEVSGGLLVPPTVGDVETDVEESGEIHAFSFTAKRRPAPCGVSIGNCREIMAGTLGCLVTRAGQLFILSNNHVMALVNRSPLGAGIPQPGRLDGGVCDADVIARLTRFVRIDLSLNASNLVDAAIARTSPGLVDRRILRPGGVLQRITPGVMAPAMHMQVQKSGRTTQFRRGVVDLVGTTVNVNYGSSGLARFTGQFRVRGTGTVFSQPGDSGSLVTTSPDNRPVGLLFAGNAASNTTFCNPISTVLSAFGVTIVT